MEELLRVTDLNLLWSEIIHRCRNWLHVKIWTITINTGSIENSMQVSLLHSWTISVWHITCLKVKPILAIVTIDVVIKDVWGKAWHHHCQQFSGGAPQAYWPLKSACDQQIIQVNWLKPFAKIYSQLESYRSFNPHIFLCHFF